ncbi:N-acetylglucosaminyl-phosphatidylinositol de-N-acetylase [Cinnamomum micranthum f. kanehirae]|uniref:N-acetylglucosaminylphosphatidylinositol deacetylase n=1 Tax=Cinnamomum micranthum f. kanehirae TaxID=337451 RepID=A0A443PQA7_9MAGN|nr:N-acetylglucosaminyl-phosphatidylinositol de-N-acetylase [Cinnamomum micranthum f. kanehirae]
MQTSAVAQEPTNSFDLPSRFGCFSSDAICLWTLSSNGSSSILSNSLFFDGIEALVYGKKLKVVASLKLSRSACRSSRGGNDLWRRSKSSVRVFSLRTGNDDEFRSFKSVQGSLGILNVIKLRQEHPTRSLTFFGRQHSAGGDCVEGDPNLSLSLMLVFYAGRRQMAWLLILVLIVLLWLVSLCIVLNASSTLSISKFLSNSAGKRNVLLVIAHPDDESMFFSPTILYLSSRGHNLHILCFSTGNADGKGNIRKAELYQACAILKVPLQQVKILDHPDLQDGFGNMWSHHLLAQIIEEEITTKGIDMLITFDNYGVSGHRNHCDVHHGIRMVLCNYSQRSIEAWELISTSIARKYTGPVDIWLSILCSLYHRAGEVYCLLNSHPHTTFLAMAQHESQWVWFRKLFVLFSSYTYVNTLKKINI